MAKFKSIAEAVTSILSAGKFKAATTFSTWKKGDSVIISNVYASGNYVQVVLTNGAGVNLTLAQIEAYADTREDLGKEVVELEDRIVTVKAKLKYLDETKQDTFDEVEFKVWNTLQLLKGKKNDLEKAKAIAKLINA